MKRRIMKLYKKQKQHKLKKIIQDNEDDNDEIEVAVKYNEEAEG